MLPVGALPRRRGRAQGLVPAAVALALGACLLLVVLSTSTTPSADPNMLGSAAATISSRSRAALMGPRVGPSRDRIAAPPRQMRVNASPVSFENIDYRTFGSSYDGYRSILKKVKGLYGDSLKEFLDEGYILVDVRPDYERERIAPVGSKHIPLIKEREEMDLGSFARRWSNSVYAGHSRDLMRNDNFVADVQADYPADTKLIMVCGEGLRSLLAVDSLQNAGYTNSLWLAGGLQRVEKDIENEGTKTDRGYARAGLDGGEIAAGIFDKITSIKWWEALSGDKKN